MTQAPIMDALWDANDVAKYLKVSRSWVYHRAETGELPYLRVGGLLRFEPQKICEYFRDSGAEICQPKRLPMAPRTLRKGA